ncbi:MAG: glycosyltransferase N-terminal domain-containing protein [Thermodesulfobacteriota bacterium]|nr:glycosyltransferase N-terminal domain-containing protein [Thermodesulfobacteriota bacterium]
MEKNRLIYYFFKFYSVLWLIALPFLKTNKRLKQGFVQRTSAKDLSKADIWIQAASAGESYLAVQLLKKLTPMKKTAVLITSTTSQGMEILEKGLFLGKSIGEGSIHHNIILKTAWFPFDYPKLMKEVVSKIDPEIMVLLETEIWPALLFFLKKKGANIFIINARLSKKSFKSYLKTSSLWKKVAPDKILAIDQTDAERFKKIFDKSEIKVMKNIKFDSLANSLKKSNKKKSEKEPDRTDGLEKIIKKETPFSILASVRMEEEEEIEKILEKIMNEVPDQVVAIFPRHMERVAYWENKLGSTKFPWKLRSKITKPAESGSVILWDTFGELKDAYNLAATVFVGGSLKPLGGQNFMEPVVCGAATITGPFIESFEFAGKALFKKELAKKADNWESVAAFMIQNLKEPPDRQTLAKKGREYIKKNQGGTLAACKEITDCLQVLQITCD